jgi:hypothetical protein
MFAPFVQEKSMFQLHLNLDNVLNLHHLWPHLEHQAHVTFRGALLEPTAVMIHENTTFISICADCSNELSKPGKLPPWHAINRNQELAVPMVIFYLMG